MDLRSNIFAKETYPGVVSPMLVAPRTSFTYLVVGALSCSWNCAYEFVLKEAATRRRADFGGTRAGRGQDCARLLIVV